MDSTAATARFSRLLRSLGTSATNAHRISSSLASALSLGIPVKARYGLARRPPRRRGLRPAHRVKRPDCLHRLAPQSRFVPAHAVKQAWGQDWKGAEIVGRWLRDFEHWFERMGAWTLTAVLGRCPAARVVRSSQGTLPWPLSSSGGLEQSPVVHAGRAPSRRASRTSPWISNKARFDRTGTAKSPQEVC